MTTRHFRQTHRCPRSKLTLLQAHLLVTTAIVGTGGKRHEIFNGVARSLVARGLLDPSHDTLTLEGIEALSTCSFLPPAMRTFAAERAHHRVKAMLFASA